MTMVIRFHHGDTSWLFNDLRAREVEDLERVLGVPYTRWDMSAKTILAILAVFLGRTRNESEVAEIIDEMRLPDISAAWTVEEDDLPTEFVDGIPKDSPAGEASTTTSDSSSNRPGAGLPALPEPSPSGT